uniref:PrgI family protein n=1 Tax=Caldicellulosiruptor owensensis TaxID=55205 RepID=A0A7C5V4K2_9FIRM
MHRHRIPYEFKFENKIVGGIMTWRQLFILVLPSLFAVWLFTELKVPFLIALLAELFIIAIGAVFAFVRIESRELHVWLKEIFDYQRRKKFFLP